MKALKGVEVRISLGTGSRAGDACVGNKFRGCCSTRCRTETPGRLQTFSWEHLRLKIWATKLQTAEIVRQDGTCGWLTARRYPDTLHSPTLAVIPLHGKAYSSGSAASGKTLDSRILCPAQRASLPRLLRFLQKTAYTQSLSRGRSWFPKFQHVVVYRFPSKIPSPPSQLSILEAYNHLPGAPAKLDKLLERSSQLTIAGLVTLQLVVAGSGASRFRRGASAEPGGLNGD